LNEVAPLPKIAGLILAGGNSTRMSVGGVHRHKTHVQLGNKNFFEHVEERLLPQVDQLVVSCNQPTFKCRWPIVHDSAQSETATIGPLAGIVAGLRWLKKFNAPFSAPNLIEWLQLCPIDAPLLPTDLTQQLWYGANPIGSRLLLPLDHQSMPQPLFSLVHISLLPELLDFQEQSQRSFLKFALGHRHTTEIPIKEGDRGRLLNINTEHELLALNR
jgi:molybdenum cofactor guanylyltransferase